MPPLRPRARAGLLAAALAGILVGSTAAGPAGPAGPAGSASQAGRRPGRGAPATVAVLAAGTTSDPGSVPQRSLDAGLLAGQLRVLSLEQAPARARSAAALAAAGAAEATAAAALGARRRARAADRAAVADERRVAAAAGVAASRAAGAARSAAVDASRARDEEATLAASWYAGAAGGAPDTTATAPAARRARAALADRTEVAVRDAAATAQDLTVTATAAVAARSVATRSNATLRHEVLGLRSARRAVVAETASLSSATSAVVRARSADTLVLARDAAARAAVLGPETGTAPAPSIMGASAVTAADLSAWIRAEGFFPATRVGIDRLARWYLQLGRADGVRGDLAFVQATLETGGFASPDAVTRNDFAGIGHCDTCRSATAFPTARAGVEAQLELLAELATGTAPADRVAGVTAGADAGACTTWYALTGVWATDPDYGPKILDLYAQLLGFSIDRTDSGG